MKCYLTQRAIKPPEASLCIVTIRCWSPFRSQCAEGIGWNQYREPCLAKVIEYLHVVVLSGLRQAGRFIVSGSANLGLLGHVSDYAVHFAEQRRDED